MGSLPGKMAIRLFENIVISTICQFSVVRYAVVTFPVLVERESTSEPVCRMMSMRLSKGLRCNRDRGRLISNCQATSA